MASVARLPIEVIGIPTEAGTHFAGQCKAPDALVSRGQLLSKLEKEGYSVSHEPDVFRHASQDVQEARKWHPAPKVGGVRNEENTIKAMKFTRDHLLSKAKSSALKLFIGGDCSIVPAIFSTLCTETSKVGLVYFDGDCDLTLPHQTDADGSTAILDSMVMSHYTQRDGCLESMKAFARGNGEPLVDPSNIVLFGQDPEQPSIEHWTYLCENRFKCFFRPTVATDPVENARKAIRYLKEQGCDSVFIHFDVDVIDCAEFPLGNYPHYAGLKFEEAKLALTTFLAEIDDLVGIIVTEVNPNNDPTGEMVTRLTDALVIGFAERMAQRRQ